LGSGREDDDADGDADDVEDVHDDVDYDGDYDGDDEDDDDGDDDGDVDDDVDDEQENGKRGRGEGGHLTQKSNNPNLKGGEKVKAQGLQKRKFKHVVVRLH